MPTPRWLPAALILAPLLSTPAYLRADERVSTALELQRERAGDKFEKSRAQGAAEIKAQESSTLPAVTGGVPAVGATEPAFPNWDAIAGDVQPVLSAMKELLLSEKEPRELGHILKEAESLLAGNPKAIKFSALKDANATYDDDDDEITLSDTLRNIKPHLAAVTLIHELQHRYDFRIQKEKFSDQLYTLETEKRGFKSGAIALGLVIDRLDSGTLRLGQKDLWYFKSQAGRRVAYLQGEASPHFNQLVEESYRTESSAGGHSSGRETAQLTLLVTQERLRKINITLTELGEDEKIYSTQVTSGNSAVAGRLASIRAHIKTVRLERDVLARRLEIAAFEESRGMKLTVKDE